jgi:hypothetical protein
MNPADPEEEEDHPLDLLKDLRGQAILSGALP